MSSPKPRLLMVAPSFFGYDEALAAAARGLGYDVTLIDARASSSVFYKIALKLAPGLTRALTQGHFHRVFSGIPDPAGIDRILFNKGDGMTHATVRRLRDMTPGVPMIGYVWDSVRNMPGLIPNLRLADSITTFDLADSRAMGWRYLPLFSRRDDFAQAPDTPAEWDWSFIGSLHSDRHRVLRGLVARHPDLRHFVHCYVHNPLVRLGRGLADPGVLGKRPPPLSYDVLGYDRYAEVVRLSRSVVDIEHPSQTGLTIRTIETLLGGKKLITTNAAVLESNLYHPGRVAVIDRKDPRIPDGFLNSPFPPIDEEIAEGYRITSWLKGLLG